MTKVAASKKSTRIVFLKKPLVPGRSKCHKMQFQTEMMVDF